MEQAPAQISFVEEMRARARLRGKLPPDPAAAQGDSEFARDLKRRAYGPLTYTTQGLAGGPTEGQPLVYEVGKPLPNEAGLSEPDRKAMRGHVLGSAVRQRIPYAVSRAWLALPPDERITESAEKAAAVAASDIMDKYGLSGPEAFSVIAKEALTESRRYREEMLQAREEFRANAKAKLAGKPDKERVVSEAKLDKYLKGRYKQRYMSPVARRLAAERAADIVSAARLQGQQEAEAAGLDLGTDAGILARNKIIYRRMAQGFRAEGLKPPEFDDFNKNIQQYLDRGWWAERGVDLAHGLIGISVDLEQGAAAYAGKGLEKVGAEGAAKGAYEFSEGMGEVSRGLREEVFRKSDRRKFQSLAGGDFEAIAGTVVEQIPNIALMLATGRAGAGAARAAGLGVRGQRIVARALASGMIGSLEAAQARNTIYQALVEQGIDKVEANDVALRTGAVVGVINAGLEGIGPAREFLMANRAYRSRLAGLAMGAVRGMVTEGVTEGLQELAQYLGEVHAGVGEGTFDIEKAIQRMTEAAAAGGLLGIGPGAREGLSGARGTADGQQLTPEQQQKIDELRAELTPEQMAAVAEEATGQQQAPAEASGQDVATEPDAAVETQQAATEAAETPAVEAAPEPPQPAEAAPEPQDTPAAALDESTPYRELQAEAKRLGIKANQGKAKLLAALNEQAETDATPTEQTESGKEKQPWEMTRDKWAGGVRDRLNKKADAIESDGRVPYVVFQRSMGAGRVRYEAIGRDGKVIATGDAIAGPKSISGKLARRKGQYWDAGNTFSRISEGGEASWDAWVRDERADQREAHQSLIQSRIDLGQPVPRAVLEEYQGEPWADEALAKMEPAQEATRRPAIGDVIETSQGQRWKVSEITNRGKSGMVVKGRLEGDTKGRAITIPKKSWRNIIPAQEATPQPGTGEAIKQTAPQQEATEPVQGVAERQQADEAEAQEPLLGEEGGAIPVEQMAVPIGRAISWTRRMWQRFLTSRGDLPQEAFDRNVKRAGWYASQARQIAFSLQDFNRAVREAYGSVRKITDKQWALIDGVLKGQDPDTVLPEPLRPAVANLRDQVDAMSRLLIDSGAVEGNIVSTIQDNMGFYARRSYRAFDDPNWSKKVPQDVRNKAKALIRSEFPDKTEAEIDGVIDALLYKAEESQSPMAFLTSGKIGSKDLSILKRRKGIAPEIRALWGEYEDPRVNYAKSIESMAQLIANHQFLEDVKSAGIGQFFHEQPVTNEQGEFKAQIAADASSVMAPLNGLYTTPEIKRAFEQALVSEPVPTWLRYYMKVNGVVKYSKTVGSLMTHIRNLIGNTGFAVANGHWRIGKAERAWKGTLASIGVKKGREWREYFRHLQELGVVDESARSGELHDVIRDASKKPIDTLFGQGPVSASRKALGMTTELYRVEDDVWKIYAFENEKARYTKAMPDATEAEIEATVAKIVRNTYPTYSQIPLGIKMLRRFPIVGTFVSFPSEVVRVGYNTIRQSIKELKTPGLREIGAQRMAGIIAASSLTAVVSMASRMLLGITRDEDEDLREFLPPWSENSDLVYVGRSDDGKYRVIDLSYTDPWSYLKKPVMAWMRGDDWEETMWETTKEAAEPFLSEEILTEKILDISRNTKRDSGGRVYNPQGPWLEQQSDKLSHIYDALEPGTITSMRRIGKGISGTTTVYGRSYDPTLEAVAVFTGHRLQEVDIPQALSFQARKFKRDSAEAQSVLSSVAGRRGTVSEQELVRAYNNMERSRRKLHEEMSRKAQAARRLGIDQQEVIRILRGSGIAGESANEIAGGGYVPYAPSSQFLATAMRAAKSVPMEGAAGASDFQNRRDIVLDLAIKAMEDAGLESKAEELRVGKLQVEYERHYTSKTGNLKDLDAKAKELNADPTKLRKKAQSAVKADARRGLYDAVLFGADDSILREAAILNSMGVTPSSLGASLDKKVEAGEMTKEQRDRAYEAFTKEYFGKR